MSGKYWKTGAPKTRATQIARPAGGDLIRQLGILIVGGAILIGFAAVSIGSFGSTAAAQPIAQAPVAAPSSTALPPTAAVAAATATATAAPSPTSVPPTATATVAATIAAATQAVANTPTVAATNTPTVAPPTATATAAPVADAPTPTTAPSAGGAVSYSRDVQPIFNQVCVKCHGGEETKEGLSLKSYAEVMAGSNNGTVVTPGDVVNSFLIEQVVNGEMPKRGPKLLPAQIRTLSDWVAAGAPNN